MIRRELDTNISPALELSRQASVGWENPGLIPAMTSEEIARSRVRLTAELAVRDLQDRKRRLITVGEAMAFIMENFSEGRQREQKWRIAATALASAARSDSPIYREIATSAVRGLLESEGMLE
jgi:hypothetical protein